MAKYISEEANKAFRSSVLLAAAKLFLEKGYSNAGVREIADRAGVNVSTMTKYFGAKENILCELVSYVLTGQFEAAERFLAGKTDDPIFYYAAETTLQLYMAEGNEAVRELYATAYSMPHSSELIRRAVTEKLVSRVFRVYLPEMRMKDFYRREIASGGIIRGYMMVPCSADFTMAEKVENFLSSSLRIYQVPEQKISEAIAFVKQFDYPALAKDAIDSMFAKLEETSK